MTGKYTRMILALMACGPLALVVQNVMGPADTPVAPSEAAPSNKEARLSATLYLCNARGCIEVEPCDRRIQHFSGPCAEAAGDKPATTPP